MKYPGAMVNEHRLYLCVGSYLKEGEGKYRTKKKKGGKGGGTWASRYSKEKVRSWICIMHLRHWEKKRLLIDAQRGLILLGISMRGRFHRRSVVGLRAHQGKFGAKGIKRERTKDLSAEEPYALRRPLQPEKQLMIKTRKKGRQIGIGQGIP